MSNFFERMLGRTSKGSGNTAKERLQVVLTYDRFNLPPEKMREMKEEIMAVISKYVEIDRESVDIALEQRDRNNSKIRAEIPFTPGRRMTDPDEDVPDFVKASNLEAHRVSETPKPTPTVATASAESAKPSAPDVSETPKTNEEKVTSDDTKESPSS
jgi:cell division topological specificity factor